MATGPQLMPTEPEVPQAAFPDFNAFVSQRHGDIGLGRPAAPASQGQHATMSSATPCRQVG
ncbi:hypothetical protein [Rhodococcus xishaensis]|uniref:hypothetical protein n=1 Tax=Rhodococcus xishaensis TaxID=2487364 RepID=UPI000FDF38B3|nr:hypothetical protein [Rhodococcus xishaensis]